MARQLMNRLAGHDRILDFSTAVTGGLFFVPTADLLDDLPAAGTTPDATPDTGPGPSPADDSLDIGDLKTR